MKKLMIALGLLMCTTANAGIITMDDVPSDVLHKAYFHSAVNTAVCNMAYGSYPRVGDIYMMYNKELMSRMTVDEVLKSIELAQDGYAGYIKYQTPPEVVLSECAATLYMVQEVLKA